MKRRIIFSGLLVGSMVVLLSSCTVASDIDFSDSNEAKEAMNAATSILVEGDLDNINQAGDILADNQIAGFLEESGMIDTKWTISVNEDPWFYLKFVTDEDINNKDNASTTYGYYDSDDNCLGYAQLQYLENDDDDYSYYLIFMDENGNEKDYYASEDGDILYDSDGNEIGKGVAKQERKDSSKCYVEIDTDKDSEVDLADKMAMCLKLYKNLDEEYSNTKK